MFLHKLTFIPTSFVVIGAGGTGGRLLPLLAQYIKTIQWIQNPRIFLIDHDTVEEKNLIRQNFIRPDIGRPKAVVLAERYSKAFDITIIPVVKKVEREAVLLSEVTHVELGVVKTSLATLNNAFIILCVDSAGARKDILNNLFSSNEQRNLLILDAGNENDFGQIQLFNPGYFVTGWAQEDMKLLSVPNMGIPFNVDLPLLPYPIDFYESMIDTPTKSCAELDQTLAINALMATSMMGIIQNLIYQKPISFAKLNISLSYGSIPELITADYLFNQATTILKRKKNLVLPVNSYEITHIFTGIHARILKEFGHLLKGETDTAAVKAKKAKKIAMTEALKEMKKHERVEGL